MEKKNNMSNSSLATIRVPAVNYTVGRDGRKIEMITIHHMAGVSSAQRCGEVFQNRNREASAHYGIGKDGEIGLYVDEANTAWANSNWDANCKAVTIENSNSSSGGNWPVSDKVLNSLIKLVADIAKRNNLGTLIPGKNLTWHSMYAQTTCIPADSELLTKNGWVKLRDVNIGDEVASADLDNLNITFEEVYDKVPIKKQDTYTCRDFTATKDHRLVYSVQSNKTKYRIAYYGDLLSDNNSYYIPLAGTNTFEGLNLSDDMIKFYIATQADGHYMKEKHFNNEDRYYGIEFHLKKERKINRLKEILENINLEYTVSNKSDGSVSIRIWNKDDVNIVNDICEKYLKDKCFTWEWLNLNTKQAELFLTELLFWDGCISANKYTSSIKEDLDIVNAIAALNGVGSRVIGDDVVFRETPYTTINGYVKRNSKGKDTEVSCVSVKTGLILVRQYGKTFVIGNCPGDYLRSKMQYIADEANKINTTLEIEAIEPKSVKVIRDTNLWNLEFTNITKAVAVKPISNDTLVENIVAIAHHECGANYYMTKYSYENKINNGINVLDCEDYVEGKTEIETPVAPIEETPKEETPAQTETDNKNDNSDEELNAFIRLFKKVLEYILSLFK